jgi:hypothetical protein
MYYVTVDGGRKFYMGLKDEKGKYGMGEIIFERHS